MSDSVRLLSRVTQAFVDRTPIDWTAVLSRAKAASDRAFFENLCLLDSIRRPTTLPRDGNRGSGLACAVVALAALQTACGLIVIAIALRSGEAPVARNPQLVLMCAFATASAWLASATSRDPRTLFLLAWFATITSLFARSSVTGLPGLRASVFDLTFRGVFLEAFAPACLWQFALCFPRVQRFAQFDLVARRAASASWVLGAALFSLNLVAAYNPIELGAWQVFLRSDPSSLFWKIITLAMIPAVGTILIRSRRAPLAERRKVGRLALAIALGTAPFLALGFAVSILPDVNRWLMSASLAERFWLDLIVVSGLAATPLLSTLAVIVDRPFEFHAVFGRPAVYAFARKLVTSLAFTPFAVMGILLYQQRHASIAAIFSSARAVPLILCAVTGSFLIATRSRMLSALDRRLSQRAAEHHQQLARALDRVRLARGVREVVGVLQQELRRGTGADTVTVLLPDGVGGFADPGQTTLFPLDSSLIAILRETTAPVDVSADGDLRALLPSQDRAWVTACDIALLAAIKHRDEAIAAVVVFGPTRGGRPFDPADQWLVTTLTSAAAAAWVEDDATDGHGARQEPHSGEGEAAFECPRCGAVSDAATLPCACQLPAILAALPAHLGDTFVIRRRLGAGGMGVVYLARDTVLDRDVALKTLPELTPGAVARLRDEARAMAALNHETLATIYGLELWRRTPVLVVEYLPKGTLARKLIEGPLSTGETIDLGIRVVRALASMHARGLLHRDLKPSNVGFTATGLPKLLDFGLAVLTEPASVSRQREDGEESRPAPPAGTPAYLPPEAYRGATAGPAFDLWALSVVLLEAISGSNPFAGASRVGTSHRVGTLHRPDLSVHLRTFSIDLSTFFERALDRNPEARFRSASQMLSALERLASR
jgi:hypothetical protein